MFIRQSRSKRNGKVHITYQIAESYRDQEGKVKQRTLLHLGPAKKFLEKDIDTLINGLLKAKGLTLGELESSFDEVKSFGQIWGLIHLWKELKISQTVAREKHKTAIEFDLDAHIKSLVFNRLDDPASKLRLLTWLQTVHIPGIDSRFIRYEYLLRAMDFLISHKRAIEDAISKRLLDLFNRDLKLCFYDLTSTYFEAERSLTEDDIRKKGYSRDRRSDREQIVIGVVMTADGLPIAHYTFPGNMADRSTLREVIEDICHRFGVKQVTLVADKGMVSGKNLHFLIESGYSFILGESVRQSKVAKEVIQEAFKERQIHSPDSDSYVYETQKEKLVKIKADSGGKTKQTTYRAVLRYVACYNSQMALKKYQTRMNRIREALEEIEAIQSKNIEVEDRYSQIVGVLSKKRLSRFFDVKMDEEDIILTRKADELGFEEQCDGWFLTISRDMALDKESLIQRYKQLKYVEHGFYELKHSLKLRPNNHWTPPRIKAHVMVCFIAFQMAVLFEKRLRGLQMTWERAMEKLRPIAVVEWSQKGKQMRGLVKVKSEQMEIYKAIGSSKPTMASLSS